MSILPTTNIRNWGILPHGIIDQSIILKCDLKSDAEVVAAGGTVLGAPTYDAVKGMTNTTGNNSAGFYELLNYAELGKAGQISFEIQKEFLSHPNTGGVNHTTNDYFFTTASTSGLGGVLEARYWIQEATDKMITQLDASDGQNAAQIAALGDNEFVRLTLSWNGATYDRYIDGRPLSTSLAYVAHNDENHFKYIYVGSRTGNSENALIGYYVRNLQISSRPVMNPVHPTLANIAVIGHSFVNQGDEPDTPDTPSWDMSLGRAMRGYLINMGLGSTVGYYGESGAVMDSGLASTTSLDAVFAAAIATRPACAIIIAGINDTHHAGWSVVDFESSYKAHIDNLSATCEIIVVCTVTTQKANSSYDNATVVSNVAEANAIINGLPSYNSKVVVSDDFNNLGGESLGGDYFEGEVTGALDNLHPSSSGHKVIGDNIGLKIFKAIF